MRLICLVTSRAPWEGISGVPSVGLGSRSSNRREQNAHLILIRQRLPQPRHLLPLLPLPPLSISNNAGRCCSPGFLLTHDEDHKAWSPFFKSTFFVFLPFPPLTFSHTGHPRPLRNSRCFSPTYNTQAILSVLPKFLFHVRPLIPPSIRNSLSLTLYRIPSLVMKLPQTLLLSNSPNPIVGQTLENPHE